MHQRPEEGVDPPELELTGRCELSDMGARTQSQIFSESRELIPESSGQPRESFSVGTLVRRQIAKCQALSTFAPDEIR